MGDYCKPFAGDYDNKEFLEQLATNPMRIRKLVILNGLKKGWWVQAAEGKLGRHRGQWGEIDEDPEANKNKDGKIRVSWIKGKGSRRVTPTRCKIMNYRKEEPKWHPNGGRSDDSIFLRKPMNLNDLAKQLENTNNSTFGAFKKNDWVQNSKNGEWGSICLDDTGKIKVEWQSNYDDDSVYTNCKIVAYGPGTTLRRRLSPCEKLLHNHRLVNPYRDSPVLTRLLKEIREANK